MRILALVPPALTEGNTIRDVLYGCWCKGRRIGGGRIPPLSLLSVATILKNDGHYVRLIDAAEEGITVSELLKEIAGFDLVIVLTSSMSFRDDAQILLEFKRRKENLITTVFGSHPTFMPEICLAEPGIDMLIRFEPELIYKELCRLLEEKKLSWNKMPGIAYRENGTARINTPYLLIPDLDMLPISDRTLLNRKLDYFNPLTKRFPYTTSVTSRGCSGECVFCTAPLFTGKKVRYNSADYVIKEINQLISQGYKEIYYRDETFSYFNSRNRSICEYILSNKLDITWICNVRIGTVTREMLALMKKAGCHTIKIGVESGVQEILDRSRKGIKLEDTLTLFKWAHELNIATHAHVMIGMPGDTNETIDRTISFVLSLEPTTVDFGICTPYPGTPLFDELIKDNNEFKNNIFVNWETLHISGYYNKYFTRTTSEDLEKFIQIAYRKFYMRPKYILSIVSKIIRRPRELLKLIKAGFNVLLFCLYGEK